MVGLVIVGDDNIHMAVAFRDMHFEAAANITRMWGRPALGLARSSTLGVAPSQLGAAQGRDGVGETQPDRRYRRQPVAAAERNDRYIDGGGLGAIVDIAAAATQGRRG